ncbi:MAG: formyltransferase family protein [Chitinophagaceae bacterium]
MNETKLILLCGSRMALPVMRDLVFHRQLAAVVIPEHCSAFVQQVQLLLKESGIPVLIVTRKNFESTLQHAIKKYQVTIGIMLTFSFKLPAAVYGLPPGGFFNIHPGPLPGYRGPDPVFWQIKNREPYAGIAIHKVDDNFDTGSLVLSDKIRLSATYTHGTLTTKLGELATMLSGILIKMAGFGIAIPSRLQDNDKAVYYRRQGTGDISINWNTMDAETIIALINACNPWNKGAVTKLNEKIIRILLAEKVDSPDPIDSESKPGSILTIDAKGIDVALKNKGRLRITYVYVDEGFLHASKIAEFGVTASASFITI